MFFLLKEVIPDYLNRQKFTYSDQWLEGQFYVDAISSRNNLFPVIDTTGKRSFLVKQPRQNLPVFIKSIELESAVYWLINTNIAFNELRNFVPEFYHYDYQNSIQIIRYFESAENLQSVINKTGVISFKQVSQMAKILKVLHIKNIDLEANQVPNYFNQSIPWVFNLIDGESEWFNLESDADKAIYSYIRSDKVLSTTLLEWRKKYVFSHFIHGDIKFSNFIQAEPDEHLRIIDFEMADIGDPCWDIGGLLHSILLSLIYDYHNPNSKHLNKQNQTLLDIIMETNSENDKDFWQKCQVFACIRLLQTSLESSHSDQVISEPNKRVLEFCNWYLSNPNRAIFSPF